MTILKQVADLLYGQGISMPGVEMSQDEAVRITRKHFPYFDFCIVRNWAWVDMDVTPDQEALFFRTQRKPVVLLAHTVIYDSSRRFDVGSFVRTSPLYKFEEGFIFATLNNAYILQGDGVRKRASFDAVASLF